MCPPANTQYLSISADRPSFKTILGLSLRRCQVLHYRRDLGGSLLVSWKRLTAEKIRASMNGRAGPATNRSVTFCQASCFFSIQWQLLAPLSSFHNLWMSQSMLTPCQSRQLPKLVKAGLTSVKPQVIWPGLAAADFFLPFLLL